MSVNRNVLTATCWLHGLPLPARATGQTLAGRSVTRGPENGAGQPTGIEHADPLTPTIRGETVVFRWTTGPGSIKGIRERRRCEFGPGGSDRSGGAGVSGAVQLLG